MMQLVKTVSKAAVTTTLDVARWPVDLGLRLIPDSEAGVRPKLVALIDRADASARETAGTLLNDPELKADGRRRSIAVHERMRAAELRLDADAKRAEAEAKAEQAERQAEQRRVEARQRAAQEKQQAEKLKAERAAAQERAAQVRKNEVDELAEARKREAAKKEKRARVKVLDDASGAIDKQEDALVASDESQRLAEAAAKAKARRKAN